jgi:urea transport system permease protein
VLVNYAKTYFTSGVLAPYWLFMLGGLFIAVTVFLPRGIVGSVRYWAAEQRARKVASGSAPAESSPAEPAPRPAE